VADAEFYSARMIHAINECVIASSALQICDRDDEVDRIIYWAEVLTAEANHLRHVAMKYKQEEAKNG
jgi:hypothetical protein